MNDNNVRHDIDISIRAHDVLSVVLVKLIIVDNGHREEVIVGTFARPIIEDEIFRAKFADAVFDLAIRKLRAAGHEVHSITDISNERKVVH